jgi:glycine cleavage system aminomethyltransferase T
MTNSTPAPNAAPPWGTGQPVVSLLFSPGSPVFDGALALAPFGPLLVPAQYSTPREEYLAARTSAWLGTFLNTSPVFDVSGPDAVTLLNSVAVNRDFGALAMDGSRHMIICNDEGLMLADGLCIRVAEDRFRTYWLAPVLDFFVRTSGLDVEGTPIVDEYFFQVDGPRSLEIMERVTGADLHDLRFARNRRVTLGGGDAVVQRLGMSGSLAYEVHGHSSYALEAYRQLRAAVDEVGGTRQGFLNYAVGNHTVGGYPNQFQHYLYPYAESGEPLAEFLAQTPHLDLGLKGSASESRANAYASPYDVGWGKVVDFGHDFPGKAALQRIAADPPRRAVTLEWDADDVASAFSANLRGNGSQEIDSLEAPGFTLADFAGLSMRIDAVEVDGVRVGVTSGRTIDYLSGRTVSLAFLDAAHAAEGTQIDIVWGPGGSGDTRIRGRVAPMPYYRGEFRNETYEPTRTRLEQKAPESASVG